MLPNMKILISLLIRCRIFDASCATFADMKVLVIPYKFVFIRECIYAMRATENSRDSHLNCSRGIINSDFGAMKNICDQVPCVKRARVFTQLINSVNKARRDVCSLARAFRARHFAGINVFEKLS